MSAATGAAADPILSARGLEKTFGSVVAASAISVDVPPQQTVGIIGANGAGKTTFVNMITGHIRPTSGSIHFAGHDITAMHTRAITRLGIARSFQVAQIFPSLTVAENIVAAAAIARDGGGRFARVIRPMLSDAALADAVAAMELFQILPHRNTRAAVLSQGVRKLLDIAMAVVSGPRVLLLDEPTSGISIEEKFGLMDVVMSALKSRRITILFVEHDMEIVERFADRVLAFYDGRIIADGTPHAVLDDARVQSFISGTRTRARDGEGAAHA